MYWAIFSYFHGFQGVMQMSTSSAIFQEVLPLLNILNSETRKIKYVRRLRGMYIF